MKTLFIYFLFISIFAVFLTIIDKNNARQRRWRISERFLFSVAFCGGSLAMYIAMLTIRHKTLHKRLMLGLPFIFVLQCALIYFMFLKGVVL